MASRSLEIVVDLQDRASKQLDGMQGKLQDMQPTFRKMAMAGTASFAAITGAVGKSVQKFGEFEQTQVAFESMLGSADKAVGMMEELQTFSAETPFQFKDIAEATRTLVSFGSSGEEANDQIKFLGDIAAGTQVPLGDLSNIFGKVQTKGKAMTEEIMQMSERGIPVIDALAKQFDVGKEEIFEMAEQGELTADVVEEAMRGMTEEGGMFEDQMEKQSKTVAGRFSTLKDNVALAMNELGDVFDENAKDMMTSVIDITKSITDWIEENPRLVRAIVTTTAVLSALVAALGAAGLIIPKVVTGFGYLTTALGALKVAAAWLLANPIVLALTAITTAVVLVGREFMKLADQVGGVGNAWSMVVHEMRGMFLSFVQTVGEGIQKVAQYIPGLAESTADGLDFIDKKIKENEASYQDLQKEIVKSKSVTDKNKDSANNLGVEIDKLNESFGKTGESAESSVQKSKESIKSLKDEITKINEEIAQTHQRYNSEKERMEGEFRNKMAEKVAKYQNDVKKMRDKAKEEEKKGNDEEAADLFEQIDEKEKQLNKFAEWDLDLQEKIDWEKEKLQMGELERIAANHVEERAIKYKEHKKELEELEERKKAKKKEKEAELRGIEEAKRKQKQAEKEKTRNVKEQINERIRLMNRFSNLAGGTKTGRLMGVGRLQIPQLAEGGIVNGPTPALIGEAGPEAVIPLDKMKGGRGVTVNVYGDVSGEELVRKVKDKIARELNREIRL